MERDKTIHLCCLCVYNYPECPATPDDTEFGDGVGNDNVISCKCYWEEGKC
jgi:hypothetical protein